jgi:hypothetical protein
MTHESICLPAESVCRKKAVSNAELAKRLDALERIYDGQFEIVFEAIGQLLHARVPQRKPIGFRAKIRKKRKSAGAKDGAD